MKTILDFVRELSPDGQVWFSIVCLIALGILADMAVKIVRAITKPKNKA